MRYARTYSGPRFTLVKRTLVNLVLVILLTLVTLPAAAQPPRKMPRIGFLIASSAPAMALRLSAFRQGLREQGYLENSNIALESGDIDSGFVPMKKERTSALLIVRDAMLSGQQARIAELALKQRLPSNYTIRQYVEAGGLMS